MNNNNNEFQREKTLYVYITRIIQCIFYYYFFFIHPEGPYILLSIIRLIVAHVHNYII